MKHTPRSLLDLPWNMTETIISGTSTGRVDRLDFHSLEEARAFLVNYGCREGGNPDAECMLRLRRETFAYLDEYLLPDEPDLAVPEDLREERDIARLLLWTSLPRSEARQRWACLLVRVMHAFAQCDSFFKDSFGAEIREQIYGRFEAHVRRDGDGLRLQCDGHAVPLADFQTRGPKSRFAIASKLLLKGGNATTDLFDWVGMRFVTLERFDALLVVRYLRAHHLVVFAHIRPDRSRNTLLDIPRLKADMREVSQGTDADRIAELRRRVRAYPFPDPPVRSDNPFSSHAYHSIQFTCNQIIRVLPPVAREGGGAHPCAEPIRFLYPYEIQIMDQESYRLAHTGEASHEVYKERRRQALKRILLRDVRHGGAGIG